MQNNIGSWGVTKIGHKSSLQLGVGTKSQRTLQLSSENLIFLFPILHKTSLDCHQLSHGRQNGDAERKVRVLKHAFNCSKIILREHKARNMC